MHISKRYVNAVKFLVAAILFLSINDTPSLFMDIVKWIAVLGFALLLFDGYNRGNLLLVLIYIVCLTLFQPFLLIPLGSTLWTILKIGVAIYCIGSVFVRFPDNLDEQ